MNVLLGLIALVLEEKYQLYAQLGLIVLQEAETQLYVQLGLIAPLLVLLDQLHALLVNIVLLEMSCHPNAQLDLIVLQESKTQLIALLGLIALQEAQTQLYAQLGHIHLVPDKLVQLNVQLALMEITVQLEVQNKLNALLVLIVQLLQLDIHVPKGFIVQLEVLRITNVVLEITAQLEQEEKILHVQLVLIVQICILKLNVQLEHILLLLVKRLYAEHVLSGLIAKELVLQVQLNVLLGNIVLTKVQIHLIVHQDNTVQLDLVDQWDVLLVLIVQMLIHRLIVHMDLIVHMVLLNQWDVQLVIIVEI